MGKETTVLVTRAVDLLRTISSGISLSWANLTMMPAIRNSELHFEGLLSQLIEVRGA
jgi:hypothetical protein